MNMSVFEYHKLEREINDKYDAKISKLNRKNKSKIMKLNKKREIELQKAYEKCFIKDTH